MFLAAAIVAGMSAVMVLLWLVQRRTGDAGIVDLGWTLGTGAAAVVFAATGEGDAVRRALIAAMAGAWALRLGAYVYTDRVRGPEEDRRYRSLRERWGDRAQRNFFWFFQAQAVLVLVCALPAFATAANPAPALTAWDLAGLLVFVGALAGETVADRQLQAFRRDPGHRGRTCRSGLWRYSRHPNYFFEWLHWWAYVLLAVGSPWWALTLVGPALMLFFLFKVTGIPATEAQALRSRGDDYRRYQQTTSVFVPWFPRKEPPCNA